MYKKMLTGLLLTLIAVPAFAAAPSAAFEKIDANKDGAISRSEAIAAGMSEKDFAQADVNHDKQLSPDEYKVFTEQPKG